MYEHELEQALRKSAELLTQTEKDRDGWKVRCAELEKTIKKLNLEIAGLKAAKSRLENERLTVAHKVREVFEEHLA